MSIVLQGSTSGSITLQEPAVAGTTVLDLPATSGTLITTGSTTGINASAISTGVVPQANGGTGTTTGFYNFKNRIINGDMRIAQRATSATFSGTGQNTTSYNTVDRFTFSTFGGNFPSGVYATTAQVQEAPSDFLYSFKVTANQTLTIGSSNTRGIWVAQQIEGFNFAGCFDQPITLSFWVRSSNPGTYSFAFQNSSGGYATSYVINSANTWEKKTISIVHSTALGTPNYTTSSALAVVFGLGGDSTWIGTATANQWVSGNIPYLHGCKNLFDTANATWQITGVQLEVGSTATSWDTRSYGTELALCQRYYWQQGYTNTYHTILEVCRIGSADTMTGSFVFPVTMRTTPSFSHNGVGNFRVNDSKGNDQTCNGISVNETSTNKIIITFAKATANMTIANCGYINTELTNDAYVYFSAEL